MSAILHLMKTALLSLIILAFTFSASPLKKELTETEKLAATSKVWGFLKYYHPEVGKGELNWDDQLFEILEKVETAENSEQLSAIYLEWIESLGPVEDCEKCKEVSDEKLFGKNFDLSWFDNSGTYSPELAKVLKHTEGNRFQGDHHYFTTPGRVGNIKIINEPVYENFDWTDKKTRLLALFRYWNVVEYFFPYKYQMDQDWDEVLNEMIPKFINVKTEQEYHLAMLELVVKVGDSHAGFSSKLTREFFGTKMIPARYLLIDNKAVITGMYNDSLAALNDLIIGDAITKINGREVSEILAEKDKYIYASNESIKKRNAHLAVFNGPSDSVEIEFERAGQVETSTIARYDFKSFNYIYKAPGNEKWKILDDNIGYVNMGILERKDVKKMMKKLMDTEAIIFDVRNYPIGTMYAIADYLNASPKEFVTITRPVLSYPGKFHWTESSPCGRDNGKEYTGKVIILINEQTQSHAEFTVMALETANNVTVIGSQTAGADGNVSRIELVGGFKTMITGIGIFYPDGRETQRIGIVPDIEISPTIEGIRAGRDEVLEKAIEVAL